jgi:hypothetical protein
MQKLILNKKPAVYYGGVYFYFPGHSKEISINSLDKCNILTINLEHDLIETTLIEPHTKPYTIKEYQKKYGKFNYWQWKYIGDVVP